MHWQVTTCLCIDKNCRISSICFSFSSCSRWLHSTGKGPYMLHPISQQSPQGCPQNSANVCLVEHRSFLTSEGGMSATSFTSFPHSLFLKAISVVMLWPVHVEKVPQASEHLCTAKLQTRCHLCCTLPVAILYTTLGFLMNISNTLCMLPATLIKKKLTLSDTTIPWHYKFEALYFICSIKKQSIYPNFNGLCVAIVFYDIFSCTPTSIKGK